MGEVSFSWVMISPDRKSAQLYDLRDPKGLFVFVQGSWSVAPSLVRKTY